MIVCEKSLNLHSDYFQRVIRDKRFKLWSDGRFYDLQEDPMEQRDAGKVQCPELAAARTRLAAALASVPADAKLPFPPRKKNTGAK